MMTIIFLTALLLILYTYLGYPIMVYLLSSRYKKPLIGKYLFPTVSLLIYADDEVSELEDKIRNLSELDYPDERIEMLIGLDGCSKEAVNRVKGLASVNKKFHLAIFDSNTKRSRPYHFNFLANKARNDILIFTEASLRLERNVLKELVKYFADSKVGSVSGELGYANQCPAGLKIYWKYERFIRKSESRMGSMLGAARSLYAIRKELFTDFPPGIILYELYGPLKIIDKGYRAIYDKKSKVYADKSGNLNEIFVSKVENSMGNFQLFIYFSKFFNPFRGKIAWQFFSHKFLRLTIPFLLITVLVSNVFIVQSSVFYAIFLVIQILFYALAIIGGWAKIKNKMFDVPHMFCVMNAAAVVGLYRFLHDKQKVTWEKAS